MSESAAWSRRGVKGGCRPTTLSSTLLAATTTIACTDLSTYTNVFANGPFAITINLGQPDEETVEATGITGNSLTGCVRGVGGTSAQSHASGATIQHTSRDRDYNEANALAAMLTTRGDIYTRGASAPQRLALGAANRVLRSDGTDTVWGQIVAADITDATITARQIAAGAVTASQLAASIPLGRLAYATTQARQTGFLPETDVTGLAASVTVGAGRTLRVTIRIALQYDTSQTSIVAVYLKEGAGYLDAWLVKIAGNLPESRLFVAYLTPSAGTHSYKVAVFAGGPAVASTRYIGNNRSFLAIEDIGG